MRAVPIIAVLICPAALAQQPAFEIATVKRSPAAQGDTFNINLGNIRDGRLTLTNASLSDCVKFAWGLVGDAELAGPDWIRSKAIRFDVVAVVPPDAPREQVLLMLQKLLAERLKLTVHHEQRELSYLALEPARNGPKLHEAQPGATPYTGFQVPGHLASRQMSMQTLCLLLSRFARQTVPDKTGLDGSFDVILEWSPEGADGPSVFTALQEQLGLKLEARKGPIDVLLVDSAEKEPAEN
jgi:uncharacterized protein (TIGR03435 family)